MHLGHYSLFKTPFEPRVLSTIKRHRRNSSSPFGSAISETGSTLDPGNEQHDYRGVILVAAKQSS